MRLKKLTILGFKSFADKISLDFDCEIVGIVGPNGCGKSNIVDAFRWVLGEQSAKSLRGDKMHDVLFAGAESRKPLNMAEVSVTLTDIDGELPIEYDEVTITRRLYRDGESEYLINRQPVRLKDVQNLFLGSGIGKNTFSVFEQGKLDQVINLSPVDRRSIFDEAAGIGRFLQRKKETLRKLNQVTENYHRVRDVHQEVEKQTKQLKKQAAQAKNFQENKERLQMLERALLVTRWRTLFEKDSGLETALRAIGEEIREEHHRLAAVEQTVEKTKRELKEHEERAKAEQLRLHKAETEAHVRRTELQQQEKRLEELEKREIALKTEGERAEEKRKELSGQIVGKREELNLFLTKKTDAEGVLEKERTAYAACEKQMGALRSELKEAREAHLKALQEESRIERLIQEKKLDMQAAEQRREALKERVEEKKREIAALKKESTAKKKEVKSLLEAIEGLESFEEELQKLKRNIAESQAALSAAQKRITELRAREQALIHLKEACEGFSSGAKALLKMFKGKVKGLFEVLKPAENAMPAFQKYAQTLVVDSKKDFDRILDYARHHKLSDFSLAVYKEEAFLQLEGERVTDEGFYIDQKGVLFSYNFSAKEGNPFLREAELNDLAKILSKENQEQEKFEKRVEKLLSERKACEEKQRAVLDKRRKLEMKHVEENFALQRTLSDIEKCEKDLSAFESELSKLQLANGEKEALDKLSKELASLNNESAERLKIFKKVEESVELKESELRQALQQWQKAQEASQNATSVWQQCDRELSFLIASEKQSASLIEKIGRETAELRALTSELKKGLKTLSEEAAVRSDRLAELEKTSLKEDDELKESRSRREELERALDEKRASLGALEKKRHRLEITLAEGTAQRKGIEQELLERHHLPPESLASCGITLESEFEEAEREARNLRVALDRAGSVNMTAIEEYESQAKRFGELDRQLVDLDEAKRDLEKVIAKLDSECRKIFKETFEQIREKFRKNFTILFNGGEANLTFTESTDVLEAGIEISAKPPGKQMRSISLLSGGEKCLTALALLFSIFEVRPAPFCILDEVDAPLDDSNIDRFTAVLKQYIEKTQFIVVTHNKKTMAIADLLLGVSMEEKGISKLISLNFEKTTLGRNA
ncbi:MAG: AAA family ATPase [Chlamydiales bacterium]|nr:AAA family ATPase [Chlamydiales bacterium]